MVEFSINRLSFNLDLYKKIMTVDPVNTTNISSWFVEL